MGVFQVVGTMFLAGSLLFTVAEAGPKKKSPPVEESNLNTREQRCQYFGRIVEAIAKDRDAMSPLTTAVSQLRLIMANIYKKNFSLPSEEKVTEYMVDLTYSIYANPEVSARKIRHLFEVGCLNPELTDQKHNILLR